jgi:tRNA uridine 5-carboxymethylaminomethyl modification enzyme
LSPKNTTFDVIVIGGGHAGVEAAAAAARCGADAALITHDIAAVGRPSCNPAIGGIGKGQIVREVDALGGLMGRVTDVAGIQFRMLNRRKGPAVWAPRAQIDGPLYSATLRGFLEAIPNLSLIPAGVDSLVLAHDGNRQRVAAVILDDGRRLAAGAVVIAAGTFLRGLMHTGDARTPGGRIGEAASNALSDTLRDAGLRLERLKTGTPPRIARDSVDLAALQEQPGDANPAPFSFLTERIEQPQVACWLTATNPHVHEIIRASLDRAPLYTGQIASTGPRYCPSIETKIVRFPDKQRHQVFLEPETRDGDRLYVNGISTSLPRDVQAAIVANIPGLERARIVQWGYAVEYDYAPPDQIDATLMTRTTAGLFLAGQINGTSGYEEAAGQGIMAGINAARWVAGSDPVVLGRDQAYIGVMIDDLVTRGVTEPYRMFTSRAEYRMHLRYDNADERLTPLGRELGLVSSERWERYRSHAAALASLETVLAETRYDGLTLHEWLKRPEEDGERFLAECPALAPYRATPDIWARALVGIKYQGYIARQERLIARFRELEERAIPAEFDYGAVAHLRREALERLRTIRPRSVGQASRISGVHPTDVTVLLVHLSAAWRLSNDR